VSRFLKTSGIVMKSRDFGEGHKMVTLLTDSAGKIDASAFGARKSRSKFGSSLEQFTTARYLLYRGKPENPYTVREAEVVSSPTALRENLGKYLLGSAMIEPPLRFVDKAQPDPELYALLATGLEVLQHIQEERGTALLSMYDLHFLDRMGYRPDPETCVRCERVLSGEQSRGADTMYGFPICTACAHMSEVAGAGRIQVTPSAAAFVQWALQNRLTQAMKVVMKIETMVSVRWIISCLYSATFSQVPQSWDQLVLPEE
jgi:DNA repair protein RecO (recombination protein O)